MGMMRINGADLHVVDSGAGKHAILFSHGLLFSGAIFDPQVSALNRRYRCVVYDHRGQGRSEVTKTGYDLPTLAEDAAALIEKLDIGPCHYVGLNMGGVVGLRLAIQRPDLLRSLTVMGASADGETREDLARYRKLNFFARWFGLNSVVNRVMPIMFGQTFMTDPYREKERKFWRQQLTSGSRIGITRAVRGVIDRQGFADQLHKITLPMLIMVGEEDVAALPEKSEQIHRAVGNSKLMRIPLAGHSAAVEQPKLLNAVLREFLQGIDS